MYFNVYLNVFIDIVIRISLSCSHCNVFAMCTQWDQSGLEHSVGKLEESCIWMVDCRASTVDGRLQGIHCRRRWQGCK
jgi:hypothetical protein